MVIDYRPWGHEVILEKNDKYVVKTLNLNASSRLSLQYHNTKHETMFCVSGMGFLLLNGVEHLMFPGKSITILPGEVHRLYTKDHTLQVLECSTTELDDVVRLEDDYGRV